MLGVKEIPKGVGNDRVWHPEIPTETMGRACAEVLAAPVRKAARQSG